MNLNCKLSLTDEQRNNIKRHLTGKNVKALATRAEVCQLINDLLEPFLDRPRPAPGPALDHPAGLDQSTGMVVDSYTQLDLDDLDPAGSHEDCCRSVELLHARCRRLQSMLDQRGPLK